MVQTIYNTLQLVVYGKSFTTSIGDSSILTILPSTFGLGWHGWNTTDTLWIWCYDTFSLYTTESFVDSVVYTNIFCHTFGIALHLSMREQIDTVWCGLHHLPGVCHAIGAGPDHGQPPVQPKVCGILLNVLLYQ